MARKKAYSLQTGARYSSRGPIGREMTREEKIESALQLILYQHLPILTSCRMVGGAPEGAVRR